MKKKGFAGALDGDMERKETEFRQTFCEFCQSPFSPFVFCGCARKKEKWVESFCFYVFFLRMSTATMAMAITIMAVAATMYMPTGSLDEFDVG